MNLKIWALITLINWTILPGLVSAHKILILTVFETKSMRNAFEPLATALTSRGHDVTLIGMVPSKNGADKTHGVKYQTIPHVWEVYSELGDRMFNLSKQGLYEKSFFQFVLQEADLFLESDIHRDLYALPDDTYDVAILNGLINEFAYPIAHKVAKSSMLLLPPDMVPWVAVDMGIPWPCSFVPMSLVYVKTNMTFWQRMVQCWLYVVTWFSWQNKMLPALNHKIQSRYSQLPTIEDAQKDISIILVNAEAVLTIPRPTLPNVINVGCIHCKAAKPLPEDIADFVNGVGEEGFVVFSLGSVLKSSLMPPDMKQKFINVLSRIKHKVVWKFESTLENLPSNVKLVKWLPQQDLLGHPKIRLFITHCGLLSLQEAIYHGVPVLGFPLFADQPGNAARIEERGVGKSLNLHTFTEDEMFHAIQELLSDKRYQETSSRFSVVTRDQVQEPLDRAIYWVEYVIRHNGALHLRPVGTYLSFVQYYLLDVFSFVFVVCITVACLIVFSIWKICQKLEQRRTKHRKSS